MAITYTKIKQALFALFEEKNNKVTSLPETKPTDAATKYPALSAIYDIFNKVYTKTETEGKISDGVAEAEAYADTKDAALKTELEAEIDEAIDDIPLASATVDGLMSKTDFSKLAGIDEGANKTIVDNALNDSSINPVQNKVVKSAIDSVEDEIPETTDDLAEGSSNLYYPAADKTKLAGIEEGANKTTVDELVSSTSTNPLQNKAVKSYVDTQITAAETYADTQDTALKTELEGEIATAKSEVEAKIPTKTSELTNDSDYQTGTQVSTSISTAISALPKAMVFKGTVGPNYGTVADLPAIADAEIGDTYQIVEDGTYGGRTCVSGDMFTAAKPSTTKTWVYIPSGDEPSGTVSSIVAGLGLTTDTGNPITTSGTILVDETYVQGILDDLADALQE